MAKQQSDYVYKINPEYPDVLNSFLKYICSKNKTEKTISTYGSNIKLFMKYIKIEKRWTKEKDISKVVVNDFTEEQIKQITVNDLDDFFLYCDEIGNSSGTQLLKIYSLDKFYKYLIAKKRLLSINPIDSIEKPTLDEKLVEYISVEKANELLDVIKNSEKEYAFRDFNMVNLFINTGMRLSELVNLNLEKIDFDRMTALVMGKGKVERLIDLNEDCINYLKEYYLGIREELVNRKCVEKQDKDVLFLSKRGERIAPRTVQDIVKEAGNKIGLDLHPHILRHTAATIMYQNGVDIYTIKEILGHKNIQTTLRYAKVSNKQKKNAVNAIAEAMKR